MSALFKRLKIPKPKGVALHLLRHSHGSHLLAAGMELPAVSERLGHSSVLVTALCTRIGSREEIRKRPSGGINFRSQKKSRRENNEMCDRV